MLHIVFYHIYKIGHPNITQCVTLIDNAMYVLECYLNCFYSCCNVTAVYKSHLSLIKPFSFFWET